jgi:hypothetical protein
MQADCEERPRSECRHVRSYEFAAIAHNSGAIDARYPMDRCSDLMTLRQRIMLCIRSVYASYANHNTVPAGTVMMPTGPPLAGHWYAVGCRSARVSARLCQRYCMTRRGPTRRRQRSDGLGVHPALAQLHCQPLQSGYSQSGSGSLSAESARAPPPAPCQARKVSGSESSKSIDFYPPPIFPSDGVHKAISCSETG